MIHINLRNALRTPELPANARHMFVDDFTFRDIGYLLNLDRQTVSDQITTLSGHPISPFHEFHGFTSFA